MFHALNCGRRLRLTPISGAVLALLSASVHALPSGNSVTAGSASVNSAGNQMTVTQGSQNAVINWQSFNIGAGEAVRFVQPNSSAIALNRVLGADSSSIAGRLDANGQVWILNPNGVLFGSSAQVNVGGLVASTLNISDADFLAGRRTFSGVGGAVTNQGTIKAGYAALLGGQVTNEGTIVARMGTVALAAGSQVTLDFSGDQLLNVQVDRGTVDALAQNKQLIQADGGTVLMTAKAVDALASAVVNNSGVIEARTLENRSGVIKLIGDMQTGSTQVAGTLDASAPNGGDGGFIETSAAHVKIADGTRVTTLAPNGRSGTWLVDPQDYTIAASGGDITGATLSSILGGSNVTILSAAGGTAGNGDIFVNDAVTWSANKLTLSAIRNIGINANLNGSGTAQLALEYGQGAVAASNTSNYTLSGGAKVSLPAGPNFSTKLGSDGGTTAWTVITDLGTAADATVAPVTMTLQGMNTGLAGNYVLGADIDASATSTWNSNAGFTPVGFVPSCGACFTGKFDGLGHTISGLTINQSGGDMKNYGMFGSTNNAVLQNVGLLNVNIVGGPNGVTGALAGAIRGTTTVRNVYVAGGGVSTPFTVVGGLVGATFDTSTISYSYTNVSVSAGIGGGSGQASAGGLVGINNSTISYSYAMGSVSAPTNNVSGRWVGGLVGRQNAGSISNSYATGAVSGNNTLGGLVGSLGGGSAPVSSYWDKTTTGQNSSVGGGTAGGTGLTTDQWPADSPLATGAWSAADWIAGNPYPGLKALPYITVAASASQTYGSAATVGIASILDQTGADASARLNIGGLTWTTLTNAASPAGTTSAVNGSGATATGYQVLYTGNVTVAKAPLTVTANNDSKAYDGAAYSGGNGVGYSGFVNSETATVLGGALVYSGNSQGAVNAGSYAITPSGLTSGSYSISYAAGALTVDKAPLTVTANSATKTYDGLSYSGGSGVRYTGLVNGETSVVLGGALTYGGSAQGATLPGNYAIQPAGLTSANYALAYADGALAITLPGGPQFLGVPNDAYQGAVASAQGLSTRHQPPRPSSAAQQTLDIQLQIASCGQKLPDFIAKDCEQ